MTDIDNIDWELLLNRINDGKCTPFIGAGACVGILPLGSEIAKDLADKFKYPLDDCDNLPRVSQFVSIKVDPMAPKDYIIKKFFPENMPLPDFNEPDEPHSILSDLPLPLYITTNYDNFMMKALSRKKDPIRELCKWNHLLKKQPSIFKKKSGFEPSVKQPVVFHLHGHNEVVDSIVLTEDDYVDFLINISKENVIPPRIEEAFTTTSLLFLGYSLSDWNFRVIFRGFISLVEKSIRRSHISVQLVPIKDTASEDEKKRVKNYFDRYFGQLNVRMYWGTCREFAAELRNRWEKFKAIP